MGLLTVLKFGILAAGYLIIGVIIWASLRGGEAGSGLLALSLLTIGYLSLLTLYALGGIVDLSLKKRAKADFGVIGKEYRLVSSWLRGSRGAGAEVAEKVRSILARAVAIKYGLDLTSVWSMDFDRLASLIGDRNAASLIVSRKGRVTVGEVERMLNLVEEMLG